MNGRAELPASASLFEPLTLRDGHAAQPHRALADGAVLGRGRRGRTTGTSSTTPAAPRAAPARSWSRPRRCVPRGASAPGTWACGRTAQVEPLARVAAAIAAHGAVPGIQLAHAGRKACVAAPWHGGEAVPVAQGGWTPLGPGDEPFGPAYHAPRPMGAADLEDGGRRLRRGGAARAPRRVPLRRDPRRARLPAARVPLAAREPARRRLRRAVREPRAPAARGDGGGARRLAGASCRCGCASRPPTGRRAAGTCRRRCGWRRGCARRAPTWWTARARGRWRRSRWRSGRATRCPSPSASGARPACAPARSASSPSPPRRTRSCAHGRADVVLLGRVMLREPYWPLRAATELGVGGAVAAAVPARPPRQRLRRGLRARASLILRKWWP